MSATKIITAITALITAIGGLLIAVNTFLGDEAAPQPVTHIIIQEIGDYQQFVDDTDLEYYEHLKR